MKSKIAALSAALATTCPMLAHSTEIALKCDTLKHHILIERLIDTQYTYRAWNKPKDTTQKPDLEISNGTVDLEGTGVCATSTYTFKKGNLEINVSDNVSCGDNTTPDNASGDVSVSINGVQKAHYWCQK